MCYNTFRIQFDEVNNSIVYCVELGLVFCSHKLDKDITNSLHVTWFILYDNGQILYSLFTNL